MFISVLPLKIQL